LGDLWLHLDLSFKVGKYSLRHRAQNRWAWAWVQLYLVRSDAGVEVRSDKGGATIGRPVRK